MKNTRKYTEFYLPSINRKVRIHKYSEITNITHSPDKSSDVLKTPQKQIKRTKSCNLYNTYTQFKPHNYAQNDLMHSYFRQVREVQVLHRSMSNKIKTLAKQVRQRSNTIHYNRDPFHEMGLFSSSDQIPVKTKRPVVSKKERNNDTLEKFLNKEIKRSFIKQCGKIYKLHRKL